MKKHLSRPIKIILILISSLLLLYGFLAIVTLPQANNPQTSSNDVPSAGNSHFGHHISFTGNRQYKWWCLWLTGHNVQDNYTEEQMLVNLPIYIYNLNDTAFYADEKQIELNSGKVAIYQSARGFFGTELLFQLYSENNEILNNQNGTTFKYEEENIYTLEEGTYYLKFVYTSGSNKPGFYKRFTNINLTSVKITVE